VKNEDPKFKIIFLAVILFGFLGLAGRSEAAPSISSVSGNISDGQDITVSGSSFGNNGPDIVIFDDFEKGTNGSGISTATGLAQIGNWTKGNTSGLTTYSNEWAHSGTQCMKNNWDTPLAEPGNQVGLQWGLATEVFYSFWTTVPSGKNVPGDQTSGGSPLAPNWKLTWMWGGQFGSAHADEYISNTVLSENLQYGYWFTYNNPQGRVGSYEIKNHMTKGEWSRYDLYQKGGITDGILQGVETDAAHGRVVIVNKKNVYTLEDGYGWDTMTMPGYGRGKTANGVTVYDDVYLAIGPGARARVEIGNAPIYDNCNNLAIITPTSWSDTFITATVRQGSFTNSQTAYLYAVDANGNVNANGYQVTIGGGTPTDTTPPAAPTGLSVN
jgi:hypothetical protein